MIRTMLSPDYHHIEFGVILDEFNDIIYFQYSPVFQKTYRETLRMVAVTISCVLR